MMYSGPWVPWFQFQDVELQSELVPQTTVSLDGLFKLMEFVLPAPLQAVCVEPL
jgi:hypothetical protein